VHKNEAMLDATFGDPLAFLPKIGAQRAGNGGSAKSLALASAVKKGRERESRDAPPLANVHRPLCAALGVCNADPGQAWPKVSPTHTDGRGKPRSGGKFKSPLLRWS